MAQGVPTNLPRRRPAVDWRRMFGAGALIGAALAFFLDPHQGKRRRRQLGFRTAGMLRRTGRRTARAGRAASAEAYGVVQKARHIREEPKTYDDVTLARKVETEIFRDPDVPKGQINVNVEHGVVYLRGEASRPEMIDELVAKTGKVQGVERVENLLHLPKTEAPMKE